MVTTSTSPLTLRAEPSNALPDDGTWQQGSRSLVEDIPRLMDAWPASAGHVSRILYSPPDWDDRPRAVQVAGRIVKTGCFPADDTRQLTLVMSDRRRLLLAVLPVGGVAPAAD
ncbi:DUF5994 family protein [Nocardioides zeae]|uniref:DUF5994 family protein n=1 Tax=Nocardioides imazamoxiresistens TaxID=3231893 RepID=A0ABU3PUW3_9ACTN|nr:DUF5994 family protein [Nocardioides zeae]MDT9592984.1 DUF5994 family protein [Nocardioides zeae]